MAIAGLSALVYLDHNADPLLARDLRRYGYDAVFALEIGLDRAPDEEHLRRATEAGRVLFTHDLDDYPALAAEWAARGEAHAGIIVCPPNLSYGETLRRLLHILDTYSAEEFANRFEWLYER